MTRMSKPIAEQLKALGFADDLIAKATVDGRPVALEDAKAEKQVHRMNKTEAAYATELEWQIRDGKIAAYFFEAVKLRLATKTWYTPDFLVLGNDGTMGFVEIKGFLRDDGAVKFKVAREMFPMFRWVMLRRVKREWVKVNI